MKFNRKASLGRKKVKNDALELRDNMERNPNYNIFVGDKRYVTNFWLQFEKDSSESKFRKTIRNRTKGFIRTIFASHVVLL